MTVLMWAAVIVAVPLALLLAVFLLLAVVLVIDTAATSLTKGRAERKAARLSVAAPSAPEGDASTLTTRRFTGTGTGAAR